jgi:hypothetical protein
MYIDADLADDRPLMTCLELIGDLIFVMNFVLQSRYINTTQHNRLVQTHNRLNQMIGDFADNQRLINLYGHVSRTCTLVTTRMRVHQEEAQMNLNEHIDDYDNHQSDVL